MSDDSSESENLHAGHVRFGEARGTALAEGHTTWVRRAPLGSPHPSAEIFYLTGGASTLADGRGMPTYDRTNGAGRSAIRGRKFYWHHPHVQTADVVGVLPAHTGDESMRKFCPDIEVLETGATFDLEVTFTGISPSDLGLLLIALDPSLLAAGRKLFHKLGGARPLGLGSVQARIDRLWLSSEDRYRSFGDAGRTHQRGDLGAYLDAFVGRGGSSTPADFLRQPHIEDLVTMLDFDSATRGGFADTNVLMYPPGADDPSQENWVRHFDWFAARGSREADGAREKLDPLRAPAEIMEGKFQRGI